jgi:hypothetical protein
MIALLESRRSQDGAYIGCMKSGDVITEEGSQWYEPEWWKFGDDKSYFRHATGSLVILSKNLAQYVNINRLGFTIWQKMSIYVKQSLVCNHCIFSTMVCIYI